MESGSIRVWVLAFVVAAGVGFGALLGIGCALGANACPFTSAKSSSATDGRSLFLANCAACHGINAAGTKQAPSLVRGEVAGFTQAQLIAKIEKGRPFYGMPAFKFHLSQDKIDAIARYLIGQRGTS
jgi:mono/diheme cytochrome c family protein